MGQLAVEQAREMVLGPFDLGLEEVVLVEQEADLEGDFVLEFAHR